MPTIYEEVARLENSRRPFVLVTLVEVRGSTPQDAGAKMLVTPEGLHAGTVGGGRLEAKALALAEEMLGASGSGRERPRFVQWTLREDVGMTCGGTVKLYLEPHLPPSWTIAIFGAGHIAQALVPVLLPLPTSVIVMDSRQSWLESLPRAGNLETKLVAPEQLPQLVDSLSSDAFVLLMTQGHSTDRPILQRALTSKDFPFIGVIGSKAKAHLLRQELKAAGVADSLSAKFHCPVGLPFGSNHPHEIALSIAAQLLMVRDGGATQPSESSGLARVDTPLT